jgi:hypothetical protein
MRRVCDRRLPEPYRTWIDKAMPLPPGVVVLPRTINVAQGVMVLIFPGLALVGMGAAFIAFAVTAGGWQNAGGLGFLALSSAICFGVPLWIALRLAQTVGARRDQRANVLRQGILIGPEGLLVRLRPDRSYLVPLGRFIRAKVWTGHGEEAMDWLGIETQDGRVDVVVGELAVSAEAINRAVEAVHRRGRSKRKS